MSDRQEVQKSRKTGSRRANAFKRVAAFVALVASTFVIPAVASAGPWPHREVRIPPIDRRAIENVGRWVHDEEVSWFDEA